MAIFFLLYHKPLVPVGIYGGTDGLALPVIWHVFLKIFYSDASKVYVLA